MQATNPTIARKPLFFLHGEVKTPPFGEKARKDVGDGLRRVQDGESPPFPLSRPMPSIGPRCHELRVEDAVSRVTWRIVYRTDADAVVVAGIFAKKTRATPKAEIDNCRARLARYDRAAKGE